MPIGSCGVRAEVSSTRLQTCGFSAAAACGWFGVAWGCNGHRQRLGHWSVPTWDAFFCGERSISQQESVSRDLEEEVAREVVLVPYDTIGCGLDGINPCLVRCL